MLSRSESLGGLEMDMARLESPNSMGAFLKQLRHRLDPSARMLGEFERLGNRRGIAVSQEELAEAVGVSRAWYSVLECGAPVRPSLSLLDRLAIALNATREERTALFDLAIPAPRRSIAPAARPALDSLSFLRSVSNRLLEARSRTAALIAAGRELAVWFPEAILIAPAQRLEAGLWKWWLAVDRGDGAAWSRCVTEIGTITTPQQFDDFWSVARLRSPGEIVDSVQNRGARELSRLISKTQRKYRLTPTSFLRARVSTSNGFVGCIQISHKAKRAYSEADRAIVVAVAELTSLALSGLNMAKAG